MQKHPELYTQDSKGLARLWYVISDPEQGYKVVSGLIDGKHAESAFKLPTAKNVGRANETTVAEQIQIEVKALYEKRLKTDGYFENLEDIAKGKAHFSPMLAKSYAGFPNTKGLVFSQPKYDGYRCIVRPDHIHSREGEPYLTSEHIREAFAPVLAQYPTLIFDGELYNHDLKADFEKIQKLVSKKKGVTANDLENTRKMVQYHVYDMFDSTAPDMPYFERYHNLRTILSKFGIDKSMVVLAPLHTVNNHDQVMEYYNSYLADGYEGQMIRLNTAYEVDKRSKYLQKHKPLFDGEFTILEVLEGTGNWKGAVKSLVVTDSKGLTSDCGVSGDREKNRELWEIRGRLPGTLVTVEYRGITKYNKLRFGVATKFWLSHNRLY